MNRVKTTRRPSTFTSYTVRRTSSSTSSGSPSPSSRSSGVRVRRSRDFTRPRSG